MNIYILMKAVQQGDSLDLKCLGAFPDAGSAREAMRGDYDTMRNEQDFDGDPPLETSDSAWIIADDDTFTLWNVQRATLAVAPMDDGVREVPL